MHAARQFYKCFSCGASNVFEFLMKIEGIGFFEAMKSLAERYGIPMPKRSLVADEDSKLRAALFRMHELAAANFRDNLRGAAGEGARAYLDRRGLRPETIDQFGLGYADRNWTALVRLFEQQGFDKVQMEASGLVRKREDGTVRLLPQPADVPDRQRNRQGDRLRRRALAGEDNPKYLNSPETKLYQKSHVLYNLHRAKEGIRKEDRTILVEGYMDAIGVTAAGFQPVVASCGTSLTSHQVQMLKRHSQRIVVNFDPDAAGANATERSINLLLDEKLEVRIMEVDGALDPDEYCLERGAAAYRERLEKAKGYFYWVADARAREAGPQRSRRPLGGAAPTRAGGVGGEDEEGLRGAGGEGHSGDKAELAGAELGAAELEARSDRVSVFESDGLAGGAAEHEVGAGGAVGELLAEEAAVVDGDGGVDLGVRWPEGAALGHKGYIIQLKGPDERLDGERRVFGDGGDDPFFFSLDGRTAAVAAKAGDGAPDAVPRAALKIRAGLLAAWVGRAGGGEGVEGAGAAEG